MCRRPNRRPITVRRGRHPALCHLKMCACHLMTVLQLTDWHTHRGATIIPLGILVYSVNECSFIQVLSLADNRVETLEPWVGALSQLCVLRASHNRLSSLPASLADLDKLVTVDVRRNRRLRLDSATSAVVSRIQRFDVDVSATPGRSVLRHRDDDRRASWVIVARRQWSYRVAVGCSGSRTIVRRRRPRVVQSGLGVLSLIHISEPCLLYTSPSPRDRQKSRMPSSA